MSANTCLVQLRACASRHDREALASQPYAQVYPEHSAIICAIQERLHEQDCALRYEAPADELPAGVEASAAVAAAALVTKGRWQLRASHPDQVGTKCGFSASQVLQTCTY